jgi:F1F0 ATPase subunit 2
MHEILDRILVGVFMLMPPLVAGALLGGVFFSGLWWTIRRAVASRRPGYWFVGSMLVRTGLALAGFNLLLTLPGNGWKTLVAGLLGFVIARLAATRLLLLQNQR